MKIGYKKSLAASFRLLSSQRMTSEPAAKRPRAVKLIATHSGTFHADEALSVHLLRSLDEYKNAVLLLLSNYKVGGVYDPATHRYDHHQRGFTEVYDASHRTKLSSAGLVYKHFAASIIATRLGTSTDDPRVPILVAKLYDDFVEATSGDVVARYKSRTDLSSRVAKLNPSWDEPSNDKEHLFELEKTLQISEAEKPLYIVYPDESGKWRIQAVPKSPESFESRKALPEPWRGLRDEELSNKTGIPGCIFIHASGFIGGA
ncbi:hypothetical protein IEQ34_025529 [Dendrobium chrysotoxum]|uniref:Metal-dependent protein hydrolase n=1 Tax=Dendrobium chrysotoxum TaxID=161865 RepID=A0AAV7FQJ6_DENCH|nr:hypothetical protein IEQ34_025529 [Dendrobium chrysotoxum]